MLIKIVIGVVVVIGVFAVIVAMRPSDFRVERSAVVAAPAPVVFAQVNDLHNWDAWSPFAKLDPAAKQTFEGPREGTGAALAWAGNKQAGEGRMTITESRPYELIRFRLDFVKPFAVTNTAEFTFTPRGDQTAVTWSMSGRQNFMAKAFCMFMSMDKMVGGEFEKGLAQMKSVAESANKT
jgi:polyketide cyclase/dehydrase/lipid transport protein